jgi:hypothetical protein
MKERDSGMVDREGPHAVIAALGAEGTKQGSARFRRLADAEHHDHIVTNKRAPFLDRAASRA